LNPPPVRVEAAVTALALSIRLCYQTRGDDYNQSEHRLSRMVSPVSPGTRVTVDGKFFRLGERKFHVKGVAYGPFRPDSAGGHFATPDQTARDFQQINDLAANVVRVYHVPPTWFLDLASAHQLRVLVDIPWNQHLCFLDSTQERQNALDAVRRAVYACARHPAVMAFSVANEIPPDIVRWSGPTAVSRFIDDLVDQAKSVDPDCLCTFTNVPPTEFLSPEALDFFSFNVYLHNQIPFRNYLAHLHMVADAKPLLLTETGLDSAREGEPRKCEILSWQIPEAFRAGLAGAVVFSFTDDWWRGGQQVEDWEMGLTTKARERKPSFGVVAQQFRVAPDFSGTPQPKVSVVVASYNAERTLNACLESLARLNYPDFEIILVDDGSTDSTAQISAKYPGVRYLAHAKNLGLSAARNTGIAAAAGEIVAFTDADCRVDEDWLRYLVHDLLAGPFAGIGGPNLLPPEDSAIATAVMASPGGPAHVMLTDREAEHIPGCNMAFHKWALVEIGGFDPVFRRAGDDVDVCWRLQHAGHKIGFSPSGFVWHYRRSSIREYLRQQKGYGEAEAMLIRKHPEYFNSLGGSIWRGRIYTTSKHGVMIRPPILYRGLFGSAGFPFLYGSEPSLGTMLVTSPEYHVLVTLPLWAVSAVFNPLLPVAVTSLMISIGVGVLAGAQASIPRKKQRWWSRPLVAALFLVQPMVRGWARYQHRLAPGRAAGPDRQSLDSLALRDSPRSLQHASYWAEPRIDRLALLSDILRRLDAQGWPNRADEGWSDYDIEIYDTRWARVQLAAVVEEHAGGKQAVRLRLRGMWSLRARFLFWFGLALELVLLGFAGRSFPWLWLLMILPLAALWYLHKEVRTLQSLMLVFLDETAKEWALTKLTAENPAQPVAHKPAP
jgi:GT2 family glycosyltransferase